MSIVPFVNLKNVVYFETMFYAPVKQRRSLIKEKKKLFFN